MSTKEDKTQKTEENKEPTYSVTESQLINVMKELSKLPVSLDVHQLIQVRISSFRVNQKE